MKLRPRSDRAGPAQRGSRKRVGEVLGEHGCYGSGMGDGRAQKKEAAVLHKQARAIGFSVLPP